MESASRSASLTLSKEDNVVGKGKDNLFLLLLLKLLENNVDGDIKQDTAEGAILLYPTLERNRSSRAFFCQNLRLGFGINILDKANKVLVNTVPHEGFQDNGMRNRTKSVADVEPSNKALTLVPPGSFEMLREQEVGLQWRKTLLGWRQGFMYLAPVRKLPCQAFRKQLVCRV
ncbi:hypothetical protein TNCT_483011 [Trichonephila clavata]|uniref:Uncharacterized protein n=1 Tax=Trichonephila clavata TaxID=2740835 RepID=A0A8X6K807_TRICU|nr:hypothetical protein TNCT_483011 [Trichonephila clavata]